MEDAHGRQGRHGKEKPMFKDMLQVYSQDKFSSYPQYSSSRTGGPDHRKQYSATVIVDNAKYESEKDKMHISHKCAEQSAAKVALESHGQLNMLDEVNEKHAGLLKSRLNQFCFLYYHRGPSFYSVRSANGYVGFVAFEGETYEGQPDPVQKVAMGYAANKAYEALRGIVGTLALEVGTSLSTRDAVSETVIGGRHEESGAKTGGKGGDETSGSASKKVGPKRKNRHELSILAQAFSEGVRSRPRLHAQK